MKQTWIVGLTVLALLFSGCGEGGGSSEPSESSESSASRREVALDTAPAPEASEPDPWDNQVTHTLDNREAQLSGEVVKINERLFVAQTWDVYLNPEDYLGKTIQYEGFYTIFEDANGDQYHYLGRWGPGCCADDTIVGFEVLDTETLPELGDWVEVTGHIEIMEDLGIIALNVDTLTVLDTRGAETVTT